MPENMTNGGGCLNLQFSNMWWTTGGGSPCATWETNMGTSYSTTRTKREVYSRGSPEKVLDYESHQLQLAKSLALQSH